jgi:hypothetical protein
VTSSTVRDVTFELARHDFQRTFYVLLRDLRAADLILGLPWLDDKHASLQFCSTKVFTLMDSTSVETQLEERRPECLLMSSTKVQKLMRKTHRSRGRKAEFYATELTQAADQPTGPMKHQRLNRLSLAERAKLNRQLNDAVDAV